jgi:hypothetical protein
MKKKRRHSWLRVGRSWLLTGFMGLSVSCVHAQGGSVFAYRSDLDTVRKTAFYKIPLFPELVAKCRADLADLRIRDPEGRFIPYVLKEGVVPGDTGADVYVATPDPVFQQKDSSNRHSYITLRYREAYRIDKLTLGVRDPALYKRTVRVYDGEADPIAAAPVAVISIDPNSHSFYIPAVKSRRLVIDIANADNTPLVISRVETAQRTQYLLTYLQAGLSYRLLAGNAQTGPPEYDLKYFVDSLTREPLVLVPGSLQPVSNVAPAAPPPPAGKDLHNPAGGDHPGILLWSIITLVLLLLIYLSVKLAKAIPKKNEQDRL